LTTVVSENSISTVVSNCFIILDKLPLILTTIFMVCLTLVNGLTP
jgi:hypothetical protein